MKNISAAFIALAMLALIASPKAAAHGHGHVMGTVAAVTADHVEVTTQDGKTKSIPITPKTKIVKGTAGVTASDIAPGMRVVVHLAADGSAELLKLPSKSDSKQKAAAR